MSSMRIPSRRLVPLRSLIHLVCLLTFIFLTLNITSVAQSQSVTLSATVSAAELKMRTSPSLRADVLTILSRNTVVTVIGRNRNGSWVYGTADSGVTGWVYRNYLKFPRRTNIFKLTITDGTGTGSSGGGGGGNSQSPMPTVVSFISQYPYLDQSGKVTLQWNIQGNPFAGLQHRINGISEWHGYSDLQPTGTLTVDFKPFITSQVGPVYFVDFWLHYGNDRNGQALWQYLRVECPPSLYFRNNSDSQICPLSPSQSVQSAYQPFERGVMVWRGDNKTFYVLTYDGTVQYRYTDYGLPNKPLDPSQIPAGRYQPVSGFGRVWDNAEWIRSALGWATAPESSYVATVRESMSTVNTPSEYYGRVLMILPNGRLINVGYSNWRYAD